MEERPLRTGFVRGDRSGIAIPADAEALRAAGAPFLTDAFRSFGSLAAGNSVVRITRCETFAGGNSGLKLLLSVDYERADPGLHTDLFVKFSRDFHDSFRDRRRHELEPEIRLAALSRLPAFPIAVPAPYFADFHDDTATGLLITQRIAYGEGAIEPLRPKCMDHELDDPLEYYRAIVAALARLAAAHQSGALSPEADLSFPFDLTRALAFNPIDADEARLRDRIAGYAEFARLCPQLFPSSITQPGFIAKLERDATRFLRHDAQIRRFLHTDPDMIALCHWNANIDNAWFWRDPAGALHCGLLDWGLVRQMNLAGALWGGLCSADRGLWNDHLETLLALFVRELAAHGGRQIAVEKLGLHLDLSVAMLGLALMMDVSTLVRARVPNIAHARSQRDPMLLGDRVAHGFLHVFTGFLNLWEKRDFGASLDRMLEHDPRS